MAWLLSIGLAGGCNAMFGVAGLSYDGPAPTTGGAGGEAGTGGAGGEAGTGSGAGGQQLACGDGDLDSGEECDDGNTVAGDRCGSTCLVEYPEDCPGTPLEIGAELLTITDTILGASSTIATIAPIGTCNMGGTWQGSDLIYSVTATVAGTLFAELEPSYDSHWLHIHGECSSAQGLGCDWHVSPLETDVVTVPVVAGETTTVVVDVLSGAGGPFVLRMRVGYCGDGVVDVAEECDDGNAQDDQNGCGPDCQVVPCDPCNGPNCSDFDDPATHHCYGLYTDNKSWTNARSACQSLGTGWELVGVSSAAERDVIGGTNPGSSFWTGGNDQLVEGTFVWVNGEPWWAGGWAPTEPNGDTNENCVLFNPNHDPFVFEDRNCGSTRDYLCERIPAGLK